MQEKVNDKEEEKKGGDLPKIKIAIHQFPTIEQLKTATEVKLRQLGFGYRAKFIVASVKMIDEKGGHKWLESLRG